jgi:hypothetical protein
MFSSFQLHSPPPPWMWLSRVIPNKPSASNPKVSDTTFCDPNWKRQQDIWYQKVSRKHNLKLDFEDGSFRWALMALVQTCGLIVEAVNSSELRWPVGRRHREGVLS